MTKTFRFKDKEYSYFFSTYNTTWINERAVELPIVWDIVKDFKGQILEVGNVLSHYFEVSHDIVDKYEKAEKVLNVDIVDYNPDKKYDLIVSISTLEHVGFDESVREPMKLVRALEQMNKLLAENGLMVVTMPIGYNPDVTTMINERKIVFGEMYYFKRTNYNENTWEETGYEDALKYARFSPVDAFIIGYKKLDEA